MVSHKNTKKARKPIETTLGKAPAIGKEKEADISLLRKPIETSISGIKQLFSILDGATNEVKKILMYECDIMYECRICRSIFRSLANFILHKRNYCKEKFSLLDCINNNDTFKMDINPPKEPEVETSALAKVIQKLHEIERVRESAKQFLTADLSSEPGNEAIKSMDDREEKASNFNQIVIEKIDGNKSGMFQTLVNDSSKSVDLPERGNEFMKSEVMEIHKKIENDVPVLDPEGKICGFTSSKFQKPSLFPKSQLKCTECNQKFATRKSLTNHIKYVHNPNRILYVCPTCKDTLANPWCVYRHLLKVHRMSNKQVRRMRELIHNSFIRRDEEPSIHRKKSSESNQSAGDSENQWINDIEGDKDFQMCAGCGKHFERKAALHSHSQMCAKRLEVCNNIKENAKKKGEEEAVEKAKLDNVANDKTILKGASKRKAKITYSYRRKQTSSMETNNELLFVSDTFNTSDYGSGLDASPSKLYGKSENISNNCSEDERTDCRSSDPIFSNSNDENNKLKDLSNDSNPRISAVSEDLFPENSSATQKSDENGNQSNSIVEKSLSEQNQNTVDEQMEECIPSSQLSENSSVIENSTLDEDRSNAPSPPSSYQMASNAVSLEEPICLSSDESLEKNSPDLFSDKVSFEIFCKKVAKDTNDENTENTISNSPLRKRKRKSKPNVHSCCSNNDNNNDDDIIFVSETQNSTNDDNNCIKVENGFAGFSSEETNQTSLSIDFSNLSYNNPLKSITKDPSASQVRCRTVCSSKNENATHELKKDFNFIPRAAPYMDRDKLLCIPCNLTFKSFNLLLWHMSAHFSWFRFQCSKCSFITFNKYDCMSHAWQDHNLRGTTASSCILPLPNWKTVLMSHEFKLLKDCEDLKGKHTDEQICIDENRDQYLESIDDFLDPDHLLFEEFIDSEERSELVAEKDNVKKRNKFENITIDIQETLQDFQKLPEPVELAMPADVSEVFRTFTFDEDLLPPDETVVTLDHFADESNDDWGLSKVCQFAELSKAKNSIVTEVQEEVTKDDIVPINVRPSRIRTKVKQNDDFVYYDNISNVLRVTELFKGSTPKHRSDSVLAVKPKVSNKSVPTMPKRKS